MTSTLALTLPARHREVVLDTLLRRYGSQARALAATTARVRADRRSLPALLDARDDLAEVDALLDLVAWGAPGAEGRIELVGPPALVRDVVRSALAVSARRLAGDVERYERAEIGVDALRSAGAVVADALQAFLRIEASAR
jgi:hypothetical protein